MTESHWQRYLVVWIALLVLTALSYLVAQVDLGVMGTPVALAIAAGKIVLVALYFMHLIEQTFVLSVVGITTAIWVVLLCAGVAADVGFR